MNGLQTALMIMLAVSATGVVLNRQPLFQVMALTFYGILLGIVFFAFQAPDVALSQIVVGAVALPLMALLALEKVRIEKQKEKTAGETQ